jgi:hypothetical protein
MAQPKPFTPAKLLCAVIYSDEDLYARAKKLLADTYGPADLESPAFDFILTDYYEKEMGSGLKRRFMTFGRLVMPERLAGIKLQTNGFEDRIREEVGTPGRAVNLDPGILTASALIMATAKDFAHRIPLAHGIYAHLELLLTKTGVRCLDWTYPDFRQERYREFLMEARKSYLEQLKGSPD